MTLGSLSHPEGTLNSSQNTCDWFPTEVVGLRMEHILEHVSNKIVHHCRSTRECTGWGINPSRIVCTHSVIVVELEIPLSLNCHLNLRVIPVVDPFNVMGTGESGRKWCNIEVDILGGWSMHRINDFSREYLKYTSSHSQSAGQQVRPTQRKLFLA
jgi:hypothetical protein